MMSEWKKYLKDREKPPWKEDLSPGGWKEYLMRKREGLRRLSNER